MLGIDPNFIKHELNVLPKDQLVKQQGRRSATEYVDIVIEKVKKLKEATVIMEVLYPSWLSTIVMVNKKTTSGESMSTSYKPQLGLSERLLLFAQN